MQHPTPRDRPAACDPANHQSGRWVAAWTRGRQAMALCTASFTVNFAVQMQLITHCAGATSPRSSQATPAGPHALAVWRRARRCGARVHHATQAANARVRFAHTERFQNSKGSRSVPPPSLGRAPRPPDPPISKSGLIDPELQCPAGCSICLISFAGRKRTDAKIAQGRSSSKVTCTLTGLETPSGSGAAPKNQLLET